MSLIPAVANRGELRWMIVEGAVNAPTLIRFLERLIREARRKGFLIWDRLREHRAHMIRDWLAEHRSELEVHYLASYSPELNPDEGVNADLKQAAPRQPPARSDQPHAQPVQATEADPLDLPAPAVPLRRIVKTMRAASIGAKPDAHRSARRAPTRRLSGAICRGIALRTSGACACAPMQIQSGRLWVQTASAWMRSEA